MRTLLLLFAILAIGCTKEDVEMGSITKKISVKSFSENKYRFTIETTDTIINLIGFQDDYIKLNNIDTIRITSHKGWKFRGLNAYKKYITRVNDSVFAVKRPDILRFPSASLIGIIEYGIYDFPNHAHKLHFIQ